MKSRTTLAMALVCAGLFSSTALFANGSIEGSVVSTKKVKTKGATSQRDLVIYLEKVDGDFAPPAAPAKVDQEKLNFLPHVLPILKGTTVEFGNKDSVTHNVLADDECCKMDQDMEAGESGNHKFDKLGVAAIVCRLHPEMSMFVVVLSNPYFAHIELKREKKDGKKIYTGTYSIKDVPPGTYKLTTWNKKLKPVTQEVTVKSGEATKCDIELSK